MYFIYEYHTISPRCVYISLKFKYLFPLLRLARNITVMQKLCVLIQSGKMLVEQERMEVIHGGFFVSWTGSRKADRFLLDIYLWGGSWGVDRGCVWLFAWQCHLTSPWPGEDEAPGELHSPSAPHMAGQLLPHPPSNYPPKPGPLWALTTEATTAPKGCQGRKGTHLELLPWAPEPTG